MTGYISLKGDTIIMFCSHGTEHCISYANDVFQKQTEEVVWMKSLDEMDVEDFNAINGAVVISRAGLLKIGGETTRGWFVWSLKDIRAH